MEDIQTEVITPSASPSADEIAVRAYLIWEKEGRPAGRDFEHWLLAESQLKAVPPQEVSIVLRNPAGTQPPQPRRKNSRKNRNGGSE